MAIRGPKPKAQIRHRNRPAHDWTLVPDVPFMDAPKLPSRTPQGQPWLPSVRRWYRAVSTMPHCCLWAASDWEFVYDTALVKDRFLAFGGTSLATELRNREKVLGVTADARRDQRIRYIDGADDAGSTVDESVTRLDYYRAL